MQQFTAQDNLKGGVLIAVSMLGFILNDSFIKYLSSTYSVGQMLFIRGAFSTLILAGLCYYRGAWIGLSAVKSPVLLSRVGLEMFATITFLSAIVFMPISSLMAILQALPLAVTIAAALILKESFGWRRASAILVGFIGVLLIIQPGSDQFNFYSILALISVACAAGRDVASRMLNKEIPTLFVALLTSIGVMSMGAVMAWFQGWNAIPALHIFMLLAAACFVVVGYICIIAGMRIGETSFVTPFRYSTMVWALLIGYFIFQEVPNTLMLLGSAIVVATGLYSLHRERIRAAQEP